MKTTLAILTVLLALNNVSFSNDKETKKAVTKEVNKVIKENASCQICSKGKYIVTHQNVIVYADGAYIPIVNARFLKCNHCLNLKEDYIKH
jgi:hypothetical protein